MPLPLVAVAARVAARQAAKKAGGSATQKGIARIPGSGASRSPEQGQEQEFPWAEWAFLTVLAVLTDTVVIILRTFDIIFGIGTLIAFPINTVAMILFAGWSMMRLGKPGDGIWKKIPKWRFLGANVVANTPFNVFAPALTLYMLSLLFFH